RGCREHRPDPGHRRDWADRRTSGPPAGRAMAIRCACWSAIPSPRKPSSAPGSSTCRARLPTARLCTAPCREWTGGHISLGVEDPDLLKPVEHRGTAAVAQAAARHGLQRISYLTGSLVRVDYGPKILEHRAKLAAEEAIQDSGVPYTFFRPTYFTNTLPRHVQGPVIVALRRISSSTSARTRPSTGLPPPTEGRRPCPVAGGYAGETASLHVVGRPAAGGTSDHHRGRHASFAIPAHRQHPRKRRRRIRGHRLQRHGRLCHHVLVHAG